MQLMRSTIVLFSVCAVLFAGCNQKAPVTPVDSLELKKDEVTKFEIKVPVNWKIQLVPGELILATSKPRITRRFLDFSAGDGGAKIEMRAIMTDSTLTLDSLIQNSKLEFEDDLDRYELKDSKLGGKPAKRLSVAFDQEDGEYKSVQYFAIYDSVITIVTFAAFGSTYEDYQETFNEVLASVKVAEMPDPVQKMDSLSPTGPEPPSDTLRAYNAADFAIRIPNNFKGSKVPTTGISAINFEGSRRDCNIRIDIFDATKQNDLDQIIEQNKANYGGKAAVSTKLGGRTAKYFSYAPQRGISSRAYFVVKGNKMMRVTVNWYKPQQEVYLPIFEKSIRSVTFK